MKADVEAVVHQVIPMGARVLWTSPWGHGEPATVRGVYWRRVQDSCAQVYHLGYSLELDAGPRVSWAHPEEVALLL